MKKFLRKSSGILFIAIGVAGLVLPILQGTPFLLLGISILSPDLAAKLRRRIFLRKAKGPVVPLEEWNGYGVRGGFTTRAWTSHLVSTNDLDRDDVRGAVRALWPAESRPGRFAYLKQVHGNRGVCVTPADFRDSDFCCVGDADALVTSVPRTALLVLSADCLPIFYVAMRGEKPVSIALAHAGWKGTKDRVAVKTLEQLKTTAGVGAENIRVAFGPSIDLKNYEVGEEFMQYFPLKRIKGRLHFDLRLENRRQLVEAGILSKHVTDTELSTVTHNRIFYSFRLEKDKAGRMVSFIWMV